MCQVSIPINDTLMQQMRPLFSSEEGITQWMEAKMTSLIKKHIAAEEKRKAQEAYVRESLTRAFAEVREAERTGKRLQSADELLEEMKILNGRNEIRNGQCTTCTSLDEFLATL